MHCSWRAFVFFFPLFVFLPGCSKHQQDQGEKPSTGIIPEATPGDRYYSRAEQFFAASKFDSALTYSEKAVSEYQSDHSWEQYLRATVLLGNVLRDKGAFERGITLVQAALDSTSQKMRPAGATRASAYLLLGSLHGNKGDYETALSHFVQALQLWRELPDSIEHPDFSLTYSRIGAYYIIRGQLGRSLTYHLQSVRVLQNAPPEVPRNRLPEFLANVGSVFTLKDDADQASEWYGKAFRMWTQLHGEGYAAPAVANAYNNMGVLRSRNGDYGTAIDYFQKALEMRLMLFGDQHFSVAQCYMNTGDAYFNKGDYAQARGWFEKSLATFRAMLGEEHFNTALSYANLGAVEEKEGNYARAAALQSKSQEILERVLGARHPHLAKLHNSIGMGFLRDGRIDSALVRAGKALNANRTGSSRIDEIPSLAEVLAQEELLETLILKTRALTARSKTQRDPSGDMRIALAISASAVNVIDQIRSGYRSEGSKLTLAQKAAEIYELAISTALSLYRRTAQDAYLEQAFLFAEKSKGGILLEALAETEARQFADIPDSLLAKEEGLRSDLAFYEKRIAEEELRRTVDPNKLSGLQDRWFVLNRTYEGLLAQLEESHPEYYVLKYRSKTPSVQEVQEQILSPGSALVEYFLASDSLVIFVLSWDGLQVRTVPTPQEFGSDVDGLRKAITAQDYGDYTHLAYGLYQILLQPVGDLLSEIEHLIIIPDGYLTAVPFEALITGSAQKDDPKDYALLPYLLNRHAISYGYSATLLIETAGRNRAVPERFYLGYAPLFENGVPVETRGADLIKANIENHPGSLPSFGHLPGTLDEVLGIKELFKEEMGWFDRFFGESAEVILSDDASEDNLKATPLQRYRYLHFATHGLLNQSKPKLSGLLLSPGDGGEDGVLTLGEIYNLKLNADLVVISACESGLGRIARGEGLIGLARGFLYAGASNLVVSLWQVNDVSTGQLMVEFYRGMLGGRTKAEALRKAKLTLLARNPRYARPFYWSSFILIGA